MKELESFTAEGGSRLFERGVGKVGGEVSSEGGGREVEFCELRGREGEDVGEGGEVGGGNGGPFGGRGGEAEGRRGERSEG